MKKCILNLIIYAFIIVCFVYVTDLIFIHKQDKVDYVNGYTHIYRGQTLDPAYYPKPLIKLSRRASYLNTDQYLSMPAKLAVETMINDAEQDGMCLVVISSYRSPQEQQSLLTSTNEKDKVALPNQSEHQTGLAVDFTACPMLNGVRNDEIKRDELKNPFETLPEYDWLKQNASKYGFEQSFTKDNQNITGYIPEPWHFKFIIK